MTDVAYWRDGQAAHSWSLWLDRNRDTLVRCGIPDFLYFEEERWVRLLEECGWDAETGWKVSMLAPDQAARLIQLVIREHGRNGYRCLLRELDIVTGQV
jgi:hypothetical protein